MTGIREMSNTFIAKDGLSIFYRHYHANNDRCRMVIVHGLGMNSNCYPALVEHLVPKDISIWAMDLRGNGRSDGRRGYINQFDEYLFDIITFMEKVIRDKKEVKTFLLGDSLGGLIALTFALRFPELLDGVIVASPGLGGAKVPAIKIMIGRLLSKVMPTFSLPTGFPLSKSCHDQQWVSTFESDPLNHDRATARLVTEVQAAQKSLYLDIPRLAVPVMMQIPGEDYLVDADISKAFYSKLTFEDKTCHFYETLYHFIFNEPPDMRCQPLADLTNWLEARL